MFQVKAQEEPSGMSHTLIRGLLILFPLNNRSSHEKWKPCVFFDNSNVHTGRELKYKGQERHFVLLAEQLLEDLLEDGSVTH